MIEFIMLHSDYNVSCLVFIQLSHISFDRLLCMVVDVENLFMCVHKEEDSDTKQVYFYLFKLLRKCILQMSTPTVESSLGTPPFESPSVAKVNCLNY